MLFEFVVLRKHTPAVVGSARDQRASLRKRCDIPVHANDGDVCLVHLQPLDEASLAPLAPAFLAEDLDFAQRRVVCETIRQSCAAVVLDLVLVENALLDGSINCEHLAHHRRARIVQAAVG